MWKFWQQRDIMMTLHHYQNFWTAKILHFLKHEKPISEVCFQHFPLPLEEARPCSDAGGGEIASWASHCFQCSHCSHQ